MARLESSSRWAAAAALLLTGCVSAAELGGKPQDDAEGSAGESTGDPIDPTTGESSEETTAADTTTDGEPIAPGRCTRQDGGPGEWVFHCGTIAQENLSGAGVDADGNVYFAFDFRGWDDTEFASLEIGDETIQNTGLSDTVVVKLDADGTVVWTRQFGGEDDQFSGGLSMCGDRILLTGSAEPGTLDLGGGLLPHSEYIASFDLDGQHVWSRSFEVQEPDGWVRFADMVCDADGNMITSGSFRDGVDLGDGLIPAGVQDTFMAKYDANGELVWARSSTATGYNAGIGNIELAPGGDIVVAGSFDQEIDFGGGPLTAGNGEDAFVVRYDAAGEYLWAVQIGPEGLQYAHGLTIADDGTIAVTGTFLSTIEIAGETFENVFPEQIPDKHGTVYDVFIATLDPTGAWGWAVHEGTMLDDDVTAEAFANDGALLAVNHDTAGVRLDSYVDGTRTTLRTLSDVSSPSTLARADGGRLLVAGQVGGVGEVTFADVPLDPHGGTDLVVAKLSY